MNTKQAVAARIIELCREKDLATNALANLSGVSPSTVYSMLRQEWITRPRPQALLFRAFGTYRSYQVRTWRRSPSTKIIKKTTLEGPLEF